MRIGLDNPMSSRIICYGHDGNVISHLAWVDLYSFENMGVDGKERDIAEIAIAHPTGRKLTRQAGELETEEEREFREVDLMAMALSGEFVEAVSKDPDLTLPEFLEKIDE